MNNNKRYVDEKDEFFIDQDKPRGAGFLRQETELFNEESYVPLKIINVHRVKLPKGGEDFEILVDKKSAITLKGIRFTKRERNFLRTADGMMFIINGYKAGWKSVSEFKRQVKKCKTKQAK